MEKWLKRIMLLLTLSVLTATAASASGWLLLGSDGKSTHYFYKPKTYRMTNNVASGWTKIEFDVDAGALTQQSVSPDEYRGSKSIIAYEEYDCSQRKKRTITGKVYEGQNEKDVEKTDWVAVQPGSVEERLLTALCEEKRGAKEENKVPGKN